MTKINVLDHGFVRLVDYMGSDLSIVRAARVSYDADWRAGQHNASDKRLINYLMKNKHTSPFEAVEFQFEVKAPIFIFRQWHRHRTWSFNELSARYRKLPEKFYIPSPENVGRQSKDNKQGREVGASPINPGLVSHYSEQCRIAFTMYHILLGNGWPRELARSVLPLSTYSHMFAKVDLHNLLHFLNLRLHEHAQWEIQQYASALLTLIEPIVPVTIEAWRENNRDPITSK